MSATLEIAFFGPSLDTQTSELLGVNAYDRRRQGAKSSSSFQETHETLTVVSTRT